MNRAGAGVVDGTIVRLLLASFVVALATTGFIFAVPFYVLEKIKRADAVGLVVATWTMGYIVSCLLSQQFARRVSPRVLVSGSTAGVGLFMLLFRFTADVPQMCLAAAGYGLSLGFFWAPLMGWLSGEAEGVSLSRRLGLFNISWSAAVVIAPLITSHLVKQSIELPFVATMGVMVVGCLVAATTRHASGGPRTFPVEMPAEPDEPPGAARQMASAEEEPAVLQPVKMRYIRYLGWFGAMVAYMAIAVFRFQMPHLTKAIGMDEVTFGWVTMSLSLAITVGFFVLARWTGWHGKARWIFLPQIVLAGVAVLMARSTTAWTLMPLMLAAGFCAAFLYANSVFYGSLGAPPAVRTRRMATHEVCLNIGVIVGSYFGNLLSEHLGPSRVYPYLAVLVGMAMLLQAAAWNLLLWRAGYAAAPAGLPVGLNPATTKQESR